MDNFNNLYIPVRERIFTLLKSKRISQKEFASTINVAPHTMTDWKTGRSFSFLKKLPAIAQALDTTEVWLLTGKHTAQNPETINLLEEIADSADADLLELMGYGKMNQYRVKGDDIRRRDGGELTPEGREDAASHLTRKPSQLYRSLDLEDKEEFFGIIEADTLCRNIERYCRRKGVTPDFACKECGIGESFFRDIGKGNAPSVIKVQVLAQYLGVTTSELLGEETPGKRKPAPESERKSTKEDLMAAFWGGDKDLSPEDMDAMWQDVENFAAFVAQKKKEEKRQ